LVSSSQLNKLIIILVSNEKTSLLYKYRW